MAGAEATTRQAGSHCMATAADVRHKADCEVMVGATVERFGRIDIFVANAGIARGGTVLDMPEHEWDDLMAVNLKGVFLSCQAAASQMVRQGGGGKIILMSSLASERAAPGMLAYAASKAAVRQMARVMAPAHAASHQRQRHRPRCGGDAAGQPLVDIIKATGMPGSPWGRFGTVLDVANAALFLASDESDFITGSIQFLDGGALAGQAGPPVKLH